MEEMRDILKEQQEFIRNFFDEYRNPMMKMINQISESVCNEYNSPLLRKLEDLSRDIERIQDRM